MIWNLDKSEGLADARPLSQSFPRIFQGVEGTIGGMAAATVQREDLVARMIFAMLDVLPKSLPRHVITALRRLQRSLGAVDRSEMIRAAGDVREAVVLQPSPAL